MRIIKVNPDHMECDVDSSQDYLDVLNGISRFCSEYHGYSEGYRNEIAVNLTVSCYMLGIFVSDVLEVMVKEGLIDPKFDDEDPWTRMARVLNYADRFDWDYLLDPDTYLTMSYNRKDSEMVVLFAFAEEE